MIPYEKTLTTLNQNLKTMIKRKSQMPRQITIDLTGPEGNVFFLLARARQFAGELGKEPQKIIYEMTSGDYDNAVAVFEREFGQYVTLYR